MANTTKIIAELQDGESFSITKQRASVGRYLCFGTSGSYKGVENMDSVEIFKNFSAIESLEFFTMVQNRKQLNNTVNCSYTDNYTPSEIKRFRAAVKSLLAKNCIKVVSKKPKVFMINPRVFLGNVTSYQDLVEDYDKL